MEESIMTSFSLLIRCLSLAIILSLALTGCAPPNDNPAPPSNSPQNATPTPTPTVLALASDIEETEPPPPVYAIEIRMPLEMSASEVIATPGEGNTCVVIMPVSISQEGERKMAHGSTYIECHYTIPPDPLPYTTEIFNRLNASFDGEMFPPNESFPEGWVDGYMNIDGTHEQYFPDWNLEGVTNMCPQSDPCIVSGTQTYNLPFQLVNGYQIEQEWIFILHID
jgi:hypothetical protein